MATASPNNLRLGSLMVPNISVNGISNHLTVESNGGLHNTVGNRLRVPNFNREILSRSRQEILSRNNKNNSEEEIDLRQFDKSKCVLPKLII